jgi:hypothetical protein
MIRCGCSCWLMCWVREGAWTRLDDALVVSCIRAQEVQSEGQYTVDVVLVCGDKQSSVHRRDRDSMRSKCLHGNACTIPPHSLHSPLPASPSAG